MTIIIIFQRKLKN